MKKLRELAPHERKVLENEFAKEELINQRLDTVVKYESAKRTKKVIESLGGIDGLEKINQKLLDSGLTVEEAKKMTPEEFKEYLEKIGVEL